MKHKIKNQLFFIILFILLLLPGLPGISKAAELHIQEGIEKIQTFNITNKIKQSEKAFTDTSVNEIQGKVIDGETKEFLPGATVVIKRTIIATSTDAEGNFNLVIPENLLGRKIILVVSTLGYIRKEFPIDKKDFRIKKSFLLKQNLP